MIDVPEELPHAEVPGPEAEILQRREEGSAVLSAVRPDGVQVVPLPVPAPDLREA